MNKRTFILGIFLVLAVAWCASAYAADTATAWSGFWESVGGFLHNAMPWNWGSAAAK